MSAGAAKTDLGVHVRAVHINLAAVVMDDFANLADGFLKHAVGGRIGDHEAGQIIFVRLGLGAQDRSRQYCRWIAGDGHDFHPGHDRAGGIGAVGGGGDQADIAMCFATRFVLGADHQQSGIFALGTGVGLQRNSGKTGDFLQPGFQVVERGFDSRAFAPAAQTDEFWQIPATKRETFPPPH